MDDKSENIEVNNVELDYDTLKKYRLLLNTRRYRIARLLLILNAVLFLLYEFVSSYTNLFITCFDVLGVICFDFLGTLYVKVIFRRKKELYDIETDKIIYNLVFKDSSIDIISNELVMNISYTRIIKILKVEEGYFLHYNEENFVFCSTKQLDIQTNKELLKLLQSIPNVKWKEAKQWTLT